jgi:hypothetical protein
LHKFPRVPESWTRIRRIFRISVVVIVLPRSTNPIPHLLQKELVYTDRKEHRLEKICVPFDPCIQLFIPQGVPGIEGTTLPIPDTQSLISNSPPSSPLDQPIDQTVD